MRDSMPDRLRAALYERSMAPFERKWMGRTRRRLLDGITGTVLDLGTGTGYSLPYLRSARRVVAVEPSAGMRERAAVRARETAGEAVVVGADAQRLPFPDATFDAAVCGLVLCAVPDQEEALRELRRVLEPGGTLAFVEHVRDTGVRGRVQDLLRPLHRLAAGCDPDRATVAAIRAAGFTTRWCEESRPLPRLVPSQPIVVGVAHRE